jgi:hypothetical protein
MNVSRDDLFLFIHLFIFCHDATFRKVTQALKPLLHCIRLASFELSHPRPHQKRRLRS